MMADTPRIRFSFLADNVLGPVTDYDVAMAYELFLGRSPENSAAINSHKQRRFDDMIETFIGSEEFSTAAYQNLIAGHPISRLDNTRSPSRQQMSWITKKIILTEEERNSLCASESWENFFNKLLVSDGSNMGILQNKIEKERVGNDIPRSIKNNDHDLMIAIQNIQALLDEVKVMIRNR